MYDVVVVGGGIVGASIGYHLVRQGARTLLIDRRDRGRATDAGAGLLDPVTSSHPSDSWYEFALQANEFYPTLVKRLKAAQGKDTGYARCGKLTVAVTEDELEAYEAATSRIFARQKRRGKPAATDLYRLTSDQARALFPRLAPTQGAIFHRHAARVDGRLLAQALYRAAKGRGLAVRTASVGRLVLVNGAVIGVEVEGETVPAGSVVIAGGAWSRTFGVQLGVDIPVEPQRGQIIHLHLPNVDTAHWPMVSAFHGHYLVPWPDHRLVAGATREDGSGFQTNSTVAGMHEVLAEALRVAPGLSEARVGAIRVGLRPKTADDLPVLGAVPGVDHVFLATGHGPTGLLLGPYSGKLVADLALGRELETDISAFQVSRFP